MTSPLPGRFSEDSEFEQRFARVEQLLAELERSIDPLLERATREVLATVLELHQRGLERVLEIAGRGSEVREALAADPRVSAMLLLHGLHPISASERVARAIAKLRDRYRSKIVDLELEHDEDQGLLVRVVPVATACQSTLGTLEKDLLDALIAAAPDAPALRVKIAERPPALITLRVRSGTERDPAIGGAR